MLRNLRKSNWIRGVALATALAVAAPSVSWAYPQTGDICAQATLDAKSDVNTILWGGVGCVFGLVGILAAYAIAPSPPAARLTGMDSQEVMMYTQCYKEAGRTAQAKAAAVGCAIGYAATCLFYTLIYLPLVAAASSGY